METVLGHHLDHLDLALLNDWQHRFPLRVQPFTAIGASLGIDVQSVLDRYRALQARGAFSRIGGVFGAGAGGSALLCAFAVPAARLEAVAALVSAQPGVNHNYEREHAWNLWFVITGVDAPTVAAAVDALEAACGLRALRLPMQRAYRIDLGFDLRRPLAMHDSIGPNGPNAAGESTRRETSGDDPAGRPAAGALLQRPAPAAVLPSDRPLAACAERGLPLVERPFAVWAEACARTEPDVLDTLRCWLEHGTLRRFGVVVRHHEAGFLHNAMTVFDVPDAQVDVCGERLAVQPGVTLAYRRARDAGWPYNLYCMVHGRDRAAVTAAIDAVVAGAGLAGRPRALLFSRRRFKQCGARYFGDAPGVCHQSAGGQRVAA